jgi:NAD(P)-dependent dehydrogenase (short-subunit alcohol dehydrogenase family)
MATNEVAIVTGGSSGMGYAIALLLAQRGASVVLGSRSPEKASAEIAARTGAKVVPVAGSLAEARTAPALIEAAVGGGCEFGIAIGPTVVGQGPDEQNSVTRNEQQGWVGKQLARNIGQFRSVTKEHGPDCRWCPPRVFAQQHG